MTAEPLTPDEFANVKAIGVGYIDDDDVDRLIATVEHLEDFYQRRAGYWHRHRFPNASAERVLLKAGEELGEVMSAWNAMAGTDSATGHGGSSEDFVNEMADVVIALLVAADRWTEHSLSDAIERKLSLLMTPGAHKASIWSEL